MLLPFVPRRCYIQKERIWFRRDSSSLFLCPDQLSSESIARRPSPRKESKLSARIFYYLIRELSRDSSLSTYPVHPDRFSLLHLVPAFISGLFTNPDKNSAPYRVTAPNHETRKQAEDAKTISIGLLLSSQALFENARRLIAKVRTSSLRLLCVFSFRSLNFDRRRWRWGRDFLIPYRR